MIVGQIIAISECPVASTCRKNLQFSELPACRGVVRPELLWRQFGAAAFNARADSQLLHWQAQRGRLHSCVTGEAHAGAAGE